jgi:hypothetical protein
MFASLDRIDVVVERDGRMEHWQTDHRTAEEIEQQRALSILFALARVLNARRGREAGEPEPVVVYSAVHPPPEFFLHALRVAGALLTIGDELEPKPIPGPRAETKPEQRRSFLGRALRAVGIGGSGPARSAEGTSALDDVVQDAFRGLARETAAEHGVGLTLDGLRTVEDALAKDSDRYEDDEAAYWSAVFKLGSFGGELIRASGGGRWVQVERGRLPFALSTRFRGDPRATVNPLGKAIKRFADGEGDSLVGLVGVVRGSP